MSDKPDSNFRSARWFNNIDDPGMTALYLERYLNFGMSRRELQSGRPVIGIAQTGSDLVPCNRHHVELAKRIRDGIRDAGGIPLEFPVHPLQETGKRPTAALDRNLAYLGLVEILHGYPIDGVVLTTGCDKTTPACLMAAATVNIPSIVFSGGPMLDGWWQRQLAGSGTIIWQARKELAAGDIDIETFMDKISASSPSIGHCNSMGTALSMNCLAEALGMSLPGCAAIPAPYRGRAIMAYETGKRIVNMVHDNLRPSDIMTRKAFENAVIVASALGASSNCPIHMIAIARHMGVEHTLDDWQHLGADIPLLVDCQPAGRYLGEAFYRAGGVPAVMHELMRANALHDDVLTVTGRSLAQNMTPPPDVDHDVVHPWHQPLRSKAGFIVLRGNIFNCAIMKTSVIDTEFQQRFLSDPEHPGIVDLKAIVFDGPEDYHRRIEDPDLGANAHSILIIRYCGPIAYPGGPEVVNMQPPARLIQDGVETLPTMGDGRQSGTSGSPSILNVSPEAAIGGGLALVHTGDIVRLDLKNRRVDLLISHDEMATRRAEWTPPTLHHQTPWEEIYRASTGQHDTGACLEMATAYINIIQERGEARHSH